LEQRCVTPLRSCSCRRRSAAGPKLAVKQAVKRECILARRQCQLDDDSAVYAHNTVEARGFRVHSSQQSASHNHASVTLSFNRKPHRLRTSGLSQFRCHIQHADTYQTRSHNHNLLVQCPSCGNKPPLRCGLHHSKQCLCNYAAQCI